MKKLLFSLSSLFVLAPLFSQEETAAQSKHWAHESEASVVLVGGNSDNDAFPI